MIAVFSKTIKEQKYLSVLTCITISDSSELKDVNIGFHYHREILDRLKIYEPSFSYNTAVKDHPVQYDESPNGKSQKHT